MDLAERRDGLEVNPRSSAEAKEKGDRRRGKRGKGRKPADKEGQSEKLIKNPESSGEFSGRYKN